MAYNQPTKQTIKQHSEYRASPDFGLTGWNWKSGDWQKVPDVYELDFFPEASVSMRNWPTVKKTLKKPWGHGNTSFGSNGQALYSTA